MNSCRALHLAVTHGAVAAGTAAMLIADASNGAWLGYVIGLHMLLVGAGLTIHRITSDIADRRAGGNDTEKEDSQ